MDSLQRGSLRPPQTPPSTRHRTVGECALTEQLGSGARSLNLGLGIGPRRFRKVDSALVFAQ
eukprot:11849115-Alexandrium_andersonii.AAC.1